ATAGRRRTRAALGICWSNTMPNMPAWGGKGPGDRQQPADYHVHSQKQRQAHAVIDCAVSQFSYGKIEERQA
ncbi:MAG: hypothetical protein V8R91_11125, partial [Butyricimonas faecihominis]